MATPTYAIQNANGNCFITINGAPLPGTQLWSQPFSGAPSQHWTPVQYPGNDLSNEGGVVFVLYHTGTYLVIQADGCNQPVTLQPFEMYNLSQLWSHPGTDSLYSGFVNLATGCFLDLSKSNCMGGTIQTYPGNGTKAQQWAVAPLDVAAREAGVTLPELETAAQ